MVMKYTFDKLKMLLLAVGIVFVGFIFTWFKFFNILQPNQTPDNQVSDQITSAEKIIVELSIDPGTGKTTVYEGIGTNQGETAYSLLVKKMNETGSSVVTKNYDFGMMVESIDNVTANDSYFWSYSVNGTAGNVAADKYVLQNGDKVEWKYTKIQ